MANNFDLSTVFKTVTEALKENQSNLDAADEYNGNHGTHMVETFNLIQKAVKSKSDKSASEQLAYASQKLRASTTSGSAQLYADGLEDAAEQFKGKEFNQKSAGTLINALMGSKPSAEGGSGDFLSTLLGGLTGTAQPTTQPQAHQPAPEQPGDLVGSLLGKSSANAINPSRGWRRPAQHSPRRNGWSSDQQQPQQDAGGTCSAPRLAGWVELKVTTTLTASWRRSTQHPVWWIGWRANSTTASTKPNWRWGSAQHTLRWVWWRFIFFAEFRRGYGRPSFHGSGRPGLQPGRFQRFGCQRSSERRAGIFLCQAKWSIQYAGDHAGNFSCKSVWRQQRSCSVRRGSCQYHSNCGSH